MHGGGAGGAGVFHPGRALEAQIGRGLQHQRGGEILWRKAGVEMPEHDLVDVLGGNARVGQRLAGNTHDQAFNALTIKLTERGVSPADDCRGHCTLLCRTLVALIGDIKPVISFRRWARVTLPVTSSLGRYRVRAAALDSLCPPPMEPDRFL